MAPHVAEPREAKKDFLYSLLVAGMILLGVCVTIGGFVARDGFVYGLIALSPVRVSTEAVRLKWRDHVVTASYVYRDHAERSHSGQRDFGKSRSDLPRGDRSLAVIYASFAPSIHSLDRDMAENEVHFYILLGLGALGAVGLGLVVFSTRGILMFMRERRFY